MSIEFDFKGGQPLVNLKIKCPSPIADPAGGAHRSIMASNCVYQWRVSSSVCR